MREVDYRSVLAEDNKQNRCTYQAVFKTNNIHVPIGSLVASFKPL